MLSDAILSIRASEERAAERRARRLAARSALTRAEELSADLEELLLDGATTLPPQFAREIRRFVAEHERSLAHRLGGPVATLDTLFDLQERLQARRDMDDDVEGARQVA